MGLPLPINLRQPKADSLDMPLETKVLLACFVVIAAGLVLAVTRVLGAWADHHISRHDLIVESKRRRLEYFNAVAERENAFDSDQQQDGNDSVIIEDDDAFARAA